MISDEANWCCSLLMWKAKIQLIGSNRVSSLRAKPMFVVQVVRFNWDHQQKNFEKCTPVRTVNVSLDEEVQEPLKCTDGESR